TGRAAIRRPEPGARLPATHGQRNRQAADGQRRSQQVNNVLLICRKELKSYFASPIAYAVLADFALVFGVAFYTATRDMVRYSFQAQMMGQAAQMNVNDQIIRPLLGFAATVALFLLPMITMRLVAEEKRTGTIELLLTSPVTDGGIIIGKWL